MLLCCLRNFRPSAALQSFGSLVHGGLFLVIPIAAPNTTWQNPDSILFEIITDFGHAFSYFGFHNRSAKFYDKGLFEAVSANVSANFTKYETEQLLKVRVLGVTSIASFGSVMFT